MVEKIGDFPIFIGFVVFQQALFRLNKRNGLDYFYKNGIQNGIRTMNVLF